MESLFITSLSIDNQHAPYHIYFDQEKYIFMPEKEDSTLPTFSLIREHDEWHQTEEIFPELKEEAVAKLEEFLLQQH